MSHPLKLLETPNKNCGECTACCDVIGVIEFGKPYYARCRHLDKNCTIYNDRPPTCRKYRCMWHLGLFGDNIDKRPDRCGMLFDLYQFREDGSCAIEVYETRPGIFAEKKHEYLVQKLLSNKKLRGYDFRNPCVALYPFGAKIHIDYDVKDWDWVPPPGDDIQTKVDLRKSSHIGEYVGDIMPELLMPKNDPSP